MEEGKYVGGRPAVYDENGKMVGGITGKGLIKGDAHTLEVARKAVEAHQAKDPHGLRHRRPNIRKLFQVIGEEVIGRDDDGEKVTRLIKMVRNMFTSKAPAAHALILEYGYKTKNDGQQNPSGVTIVYVNNWRDPHAEIKQLETQETLQLGIDVENIQSETWGESLPAESPSRAEDNSRTQG